MAYLTPRTYPMLERLKTATGYSYSRIIEDLVSERVARLDDLEAKLSVSTQTPPPTKGESDHDQVSNPLL